MTITINILNEKVLSLFRNLELLNLIQLPEDQAVKEEDSTKKQPPTSDNNAARFKGLLTSAEADKYHTYLEQTRSEWNRDF